MKELLLQWMSERGSGSWGQFAAAYRWGNEDADSGDTYAYMRTLSTLGHAEIDWASGEWAMAPTMVTLLPDAGGHGLITGARTGKMRSHLEDGLSHMPNVFPFFQEQSRGPDVCFVACDSERDLTELADELQVPYEHSVAERLCAILPSVDAMLASRAAMPGVPDLGVERFDAERGRWYSVEHDRDTGMYRYERRGRRELRWKDPEGQVFQVDQALGVYAELRRLGIWGVIRWYEDSLHGSLGVRLHAPLPVLHARAAAMCSGLAPIRQGQLLMYRNVPLALAERIAETLDQRLAVTSAAEAAA